MQESISPCYTPMVVCYTWHPDPDSTIPLHPSHMDPIFYFRGDVPSCSTDNSTHNQLLGPTTLYIAGRFIHATEPSSSPLYELSHSVGFLSDADRKVSLHRLDGQRTVLGRKAPARKRHLFDLAHAPPAEPDPFAFRADAVSRCAPCDLGFRPFSPRQGVLASLGNARHKGYQVHRVVRTRGSGDDDEPVVFTAVPSREAGVGFEWSDGEGRKLAREAETDDLMSLEVTAETEVGTRDALVAAWMLRVWFELAQVDYREPERASATTRFEARRDVTADDMMLSV